MAKTNFTKVEEALAEGMRQMTMQNLHKLADSIQAVESADTKESMAEAKKKLITILKFEFNWMEKQDNTLYQKLGITRDEIKKILSQKENLTDEEFNHVKTIHEKLTELKKELEKVSPTKSDDELIEKERVKHINKRFNVKDDWLPLH